VLRLTPEPDPLIYEHLSTPLPVSLIVSLLAKLQELLVTQLAGHVDLFHLVIADNLRQEDLSLTLT
jgi:hypothetical protein